MQLSSKNLMSRNPVNESYLPEYERNQLRENLEINSALKQASLKQASQRTTAALNRDVIYSVEMATHARRFWRQAPELNKQVTIVSKFQNLVTTWKKDTIFLSSSSEKFSHPAYLKIIGLGEPAVSLILKEMKENGGHWFLALRSITDEDPVNSADAGKIKKMTEAWLQWGMQNGYL